MNKDIKVFNKTLNIIIYKKYYIPSPRGCISEIQDLFCIQKSVNVVYGPKCTCSYLIYETKQDWAWETT